MKIRFLGITTEQFSISDGEKESIISSDSPVFESSPHQQILRIEQISSIKPKKKSQKIIRNILSFLTVAIRALLVPNKSLESCVTPYRIIQNWNLSGDFELETAVFFHKCEYIEFEGRYNPPFWEHGKEIREEKATYELDQYALDFQLAERRNSVLFGGILLILLSILLFITSWVWEAYTLGIISIGLFCLFTPIACIQFIKAKKKQKKLVEKLLRGLPTIGEREKNSSRV